MANLLTYPFKTMRITQRYDGSTSHLPHMTGSPKEYALDEGGVDAGRDWLFCPCDSMKVVRIYGVGNKGVNSVWLTSTTKCDLANGKQSIVTIILTHPNDDDLRKLKVGQLFKRGDKICREGADGAGGNHIHMAVGLGTITGNGWVCNSKNKWVLTTTGGAIRPEDAFFIDPAFTTVKDNKGLKFKTTPQQNRLCLYRVTAQLLFVRTGPGTQYPFLPFSSLSADAQRQILALTGEKRNGYVKGLAFNAREIKDDWAKTDSGWVCLKYCEACA